jgi:hypothetical protein
MKTTARKTSTARSRRFREKVAEMGYRRMEITANVTAIEHLRAVAKARKLDTYEAMELAVKLLVRRHNADVSGNGGAKQ